ncbi:MAG: hypothetical protein IPF92_30770 [Myxococcales bacterium]|nr:hypothetical protein [Myxococcales bacterium]
MDVVLNELSIGAESEAELEEQLVRLVGTLRYLFSHGVARAVRAVRGVMDRVVVGEVTLRSWLSSKGKRLEKQFLQRLLDRAPPHVDDLLQRVEQERHVQLEFTLGDEGAPGLGLAHVLDLPGASFDGDPRFKVNRVEIRVSTLADEEGADLVETRVGVRHVHSPTCVDGHRTWIEERIKRDVKSGEELWARREELFPRLDFCDRVEKQLAALSGREACFAQIVRHLHVLSRTALDWQEGEFDPPLDWSGERALTMKTYAAQRTFTCPDGAQRVFEPHSKLHVWNKRIHFFPMRDTRRVLVGHVGDHLPTTNFK